MPIQINELVIRAEIRDTTGKETEKLPDEKEKERIQHILDDILTTIKNKNER